MASEPVAPSIVFICTVGASDSPASELQRDTVRVREVAPMLAASTGRATLPAMDIAGILRAKPSPLRGARAWSGGRTLLWGGGANDPPALQTSGQRMANVDTHLATHEHDTVCILTCMLFLVLSSRNPASVRSKMAEMVNNYSRAAVRRHADEVYPLCKRLRALDEALHPFTFVLSCMLCRGGSRDHATHARLLEDILQQRTTNEAFGEEPLRANTDRALALAAVDHAETLTALVPGFQQPLGPRCRRDKWAHSGRRRLHPSSREGRDRTTTPMEARVGLLAPSWQCDATGKASPPRARASCFATETPVHKVDLGVG